MKTVSLGAPDRWDYVVFHAGTSRVYVAHGDEITVVDANSGEIAGHVKSFPGITHGIALVAASNRGYTDEGEAGKAHSFDLKTFAVISARTMGINPETGRLFLAAADITPNAPPDKNSGRIPTVPGSLKLLFLDPAQ